MPGRRRTKRRFRRLWQRPEYEFDFGDWVLAIYLAVSSAAISAAMPEISGQEEAETSKLGRNKF